MIPLAGWVIVGPDGNCIIYTFSVSQAAAWRTYIVPKTDTKSRLIKLGFTCQLVTIQSKEG